MRRIQIEMHPNGSGHTETMKLNELWDSRMALVSHRLPHKELYCAGESMKCTRRKPNTWGGKGSCDTGGGGGGSVASPWKQWRHDGARNLERNTQQHVGNQERLREKPIYIQSTVTLDPQI